MGYDASLCIVGVRPPDAKWKKMKAVWDACEAAGTDVPAEVDEFFGDDGPSPDGIGVELVKETVDNGSEWMTTGVRGGRTGNYYLIEVEKLPKNITHIKAWISESY